jgi:cystathionine beta-lyase
LAFRLFLDHARIGFSAGETFEPNCAPFVRLNFATSTRILDDILDRIAATCADARLNSNLSAKAGG